MDVLREFLEFIEYSKPQPVAELLSRVLLKSRALTGAENQDLLHAAFTPYQPSYSCSRYSFK